MEPRKPAERSASAARPPAWPAPAITIFSMDGIDASNSLAPDIFPFGHIREAS